MARLTLVKPSSRPAARRTPSGAHQFLAIVAESEPLIWRRIKVAHRATWWDLHVALVYEGRVVPEVAFRWSRCVAGACAAPLEDSGGIHGYYDTLAARSDRRHPLHQDVKDWVPKGFDPAHFDPREVVVSDPRRRLKALLAGLER